MVCLGEEQWSRAEADPACGPRVNRKWTQGLAGHKRQVNNGYGSGWEIQSPGTSAACSPGNQAACVTQEASEAQR